MLTVLGLTSCTTMSDRTEWKRCRVYMGDFGDDKTFTLPSKTATLQIDIPQGFTITPDKDIPEDVAGLIVKNRGRRFLRIQGDNFPGIFYFERRPELVKMKVANFSMFTQWRGNQIIERIICIPTDYAFPAFILVEFHDIPTAEIPTAERIVSSIVLELKDKPVKRAPAP